MSRRENSAGLFVNPNENNPNENGKKQDNLITGFIPAILCGPLKVKAPAAFWANQNRGAVHASSLVVDSKVSAEGDAASAEGDAKKPMEMGFSGPR